MQLTADKDLRRILREAEEIGWTFTKHRRHIRGKHADGVRMTTISVSPSDYRAVRNIRKFLGLPQV